MSATDSDNSIDWLASDNDEEQESEREPDCAGRRSQTEASSSHLSGEEERGEWSEVREASGGESPSSGLCQTRLRGLKRRRRLSQEEEGEEEGLISGLSEKDRVFSRKCLELQVYVQPLSAILRGLRSGRYRERLSSFQESVAMDRIQRIMGVLQNPCMGEKYINIILKMEEMLKSWFPNVKLPEPAPTHAEDGLPTKRLKLPPPAAVASSDPSPGAKSLRVTDLTPPAAYSASNLKWLHTSPICSPAAAEQAPPASPRLAAPRAPLTQDNAVSSSTDTNAQPPARGPPAPPAPPPPPPPPGKISAPCLERLLKSTESIITRKGSALTDSSWS